MIDKILMYMGILALVSCFAGVAAFLWVCVWTFFEETTAGALFIEWLKGKRKEE